MIPHCDLLTHPQISIESSIHLNRIIYFLLSMLINILWNAVNIIEVILNCLKIAGREMKIYLKCSRISTGLIKMKVSNSSLKLLLLIYDTSLELQNANSCLPRDYINRQLHKTSSTLSIIIKVFNMQPKYFLSNPNSTFYEYWLKLFSMYHIIFTKNLSAVLKNSVLNALYIKSSCLGKTRVTLVKLSEPFLLNALHLSLIIKLFE